MDPYKRKYKKRIIWRSNHESVLLDMWEQNIEALSNTSTNARKIKTWEAIADRLKSDKFPVTALEVKMKIYNLRTKYNKELNLAQKTGTPSTWPFYAQTERIIERNNMINSGQIIKEEAMSEGEEEEEDEEETEPSVVNHACENSEAESDDESFVSEKSILLDTKTNMISVAKNLLAEAPPILPAPTKNKATKRDHQSKLLDEYKKCSTKLDYFMKQMKSTDAKLLELETKKVRLLEKQTEDGTELKNAFLSLLKACERQNKR